MRVSSERGSILILTALSMVLILGVVALAVDGSYMYTERNRLQAAADAAAKSAAFELFYATGGDLQAFANREAVLHGFAPNPGGDTDIIVTIPPDQGRFLGVPGYVQVRASKQETTFFGTILGWASLTPAAIAVAGTSSGPNCIQTLAPVGSVPPALSIGNSTLTMPGCAIASSGDLVSTNPGGQGEIISAGTSIGADACIGNCANMGTITTNAPPPYDQLAAGVPAMPTLSGCGPAPSSGPVGGGGACYSSMVVDGTVTLGAGDTYFTGPITFTNNSLLQGTNVTLILADGASIDASNRANISLSAPTSGGYSPIALYQPATNALISDFNNSTTFNVNGAVYMPSGGLDFRNGFSATTDCVLLIVHSLAINNGSGNLANNCSAFAGSPLLTVSLAE